MNLSYVGNFEPPYSTENDVRKAFEHLGHEVIQLQENQTTWQQVRDAAFSSDLVLWTATWDAAQPLAETLDTLRQCAMRGIPTATLHLDTFWPVSRGGRKWWMSPMMFTRYVFTADGDWPEKWDKLGVDHTWLPPAVRHDAARFGKARPEYQCDVAFLGSDGRGYHESEWPYRRELVTKLREMCARNGWSFRNPGGSEPKVERGEDLNDFYASAKVTVGDSLCINKEKAHYWSDRVHEATGRGGLLIMPQIDALEDWYPMMPMYPWGDFESLELTIKKALKDDEGRLAIRLATYDITIKHHTYVNRVESLLEKVGL